MSVGSVNKALAGFVKRFKQNAENRDYLNTKPHAVIISKQYLRAVGLSEQAIGIIHSQVRTYVKNVNDNNSGPAEFREDLGVVYFLSPGTSSNFSKSARVRRIVSDVAKTVDNSDLTFETGHTLTANITESAYTKTQRLRNVKAKQSVQAAYKTAVDKYRGAVLEAFSTNYGVDIDVDLLREQVKGKTSSQFLVFITPQTKDFNQKVLNSLEREFKTDFIGGVLATLKGSKSFSEMVYESLVDSFLGKKVKSYKLSTKGKASIKPKAGKSTESPKLNDKRKDVDDLNVIRLQTLINLRLHDQIRKNMGKGRSKNVLNYRTGRFAKSAEASAIVNSRADYLEVFYTYQRYPYDTFLPGGRLYKPGRNPKTIIGRSIRQLATEFVSNNFKVQPILRS